MISRFRVGLMAAATFVVLLLAACNVNLWTGGDGGGGGGGGSIVSPTASPSPGSSACDVSHIDLGTEGDETEIPPGGMVKLVFSAFGPQKELEGQCLNGLSPIYNVGPPCQRLGGGLDAAVYAPPGAPVGATCTVSASLGQHKSQERTLVVTAGSGTSSVDPPVPEPEPSPPDLGVVDRDL